jgi:hypothetical protein
LGVRSATGLLGILAGHLHPPVVMGACTVGRRGDGRGASPSGRLRASPGVGQRRCAGSCWLFERYPAWRRRGADRGCLSLTTPDPTRLAHPADTSTASSGIAVGQAGSGTGQASAGDTLAREPPSRR